VRSFAAAARLRACAETRAQNFGGSDSFGGDEDGADDDSDDELPPLGDAPPADGN